MNPASASRRRIYLMRHGDVRYAAPPGSRIDPRNVPLTEQGREQAGSAAASLSSVPLDRVVCSGLPRTRETAEIVCRKRGLEIEERAALEEVRPGDLREIPPETFEQEFVGAFDSPQRWDQAFLRGETWDSVRERVLGCLKELLAEPGWQHLLLVAHGGVNRVILLDVLGLGLDRVGVLEQDPAALNILEIDPEGAILVRLLNHTPYDPGKERLVERTMERLFRQLRESQT